MDGADEQFGITGSELGTFTIDGTDIAGTANKVTVPNWGGEGVPGEGYFVYLHFDNAKKFYSANTPEGKDFDESGNLLFRLGEEAITAEWLDIEDANGTRVRYHLTRIGAAATIALEKGAPVAKRAAAKKKGA